MNVERQGHFECFLATIAALSDTSLAATRARALALTVEVNGEPIPWADLAWRDIDAWLTVADTLARECGLSYDKTAFYVATGSLDSTLPTRGRGTVRVKHDSVSHIMPWEDGLVWDPENPEIGQTLDTWCSAHPGWTVYDIQTQCDFRSLWWVVVREAYYNIRSRPSYRSSSVPDRAQIAALPTWRVHQKVERILFFNNARRYYP